MIVRDIQIRFRDSTTDSLQDYTNETLILAPLWDYEIEIIERVCVVIEPQTGELDQPDPNGFVSALPTAWAAGNQFSITLLSQDWENDGFAVGDRVFLFVKGGNAYITVIAAIRQINASAASFTILSVNAGVPPNFQLPVEIVCFLIDDAPRVLPQFHHGSGAGPTSPLSGIAFTTPHADAFNISAAPSNALPAMNYNLLKYSIYETDIDNAFPGLNPRRFREYTYRIKGTQFYAYRTNLDPTAQVPTTLYNLNGYLEIVIQKRSPNRDLQLTFDCLLLHPNRIENTLSFIQPGTLTVSGGSGTLTPPAGFTPQRSRIALLGSDAHHSSLTIANSLDLTAPTPPPALPANRAGAYSVGVLVGRSGGKWVAVMTNKVESTTPAAGLFDVLRPELASVLYRYDAFVAVLRRPIQAGVYTIQTLIEYQNNFYVIDEIDYDTTNPQTPLTFIATPSFISNIFPTYLTPIDADFLRIERIDLYEEISAGQTRTIFILPMPARRTPPTIPFAPTQPRSGLLYDLAQWAGGQLALKWRCFTPDGNVYDSQILHFPVPNIIPSPDTPIIGTITESSTGIEYKLSPSGDIEDPQLYSIIRIALFRAPASYRPLYQSILRVTEYFPYPKISEIDPRIDIYHYPVFGFEAFIDKTSLPPGDYSLHFRISLRKQSGASSAIAIRDYSFFYDFTTPAPSTPPSAPLPDTGLCPHRTPALLGEGWQYLYKDEQDRWQYSDTNLAGCSLENYCTCFEIVSEIPKSFIDIIGFFRGSVQGKPVPPGSRHKARFVGTIKRIADEVESEAFISSQYKQEDIIRAFRERYEIELLILTPCELSHIDLLKYAEKVEIVNRSNKLLPQVLSDLVITEVSIDNETTHLRARLSLRTLHWRREYRRQG